MRTIHCVIAAAVSLAASLAAHGQTLRLEVPMHAIDANGAEQAIGIITVTDGADGLTFTPNLWGLPPGAHGFHVHQNPTCQPANDPAKNQMAPAFAAGGHLDPDKTGHHEGPAGHGHLGDLPALQVDASGKATTPVVAPRLKLADLTGRSLMIHAGGDNYSDTPEKLGGGGARIACGVI
jgi:superoxide dismutase, Cu-Zn family